MAEEQDRASIQLVRKLAHRVGCSPQSCRCEECVAIRRVCILAGEALDMKAAKKRKEEKLQQGR